jgi:predicted DNA-binding transcriptional regulator YafY
MGTAERRHEIMKTLCRRRHETIRNLAFEFGVSMRTIQRDIDALSRTEPIYTQVGKYGGGVYVVEDYTMDHMYMTDTELGVLQKLYIAADADFSLLTKDEKNVLSHLISQYSKPKIKNKGILS